MAKLMERAELSSQRKYADMSKVIPEVAKMAEEESGHEKTLLNMVSDLRLKGTGTWIISVNLVLLSVAGLGVALSLLLADLKLVGFAVFSGAVAVSLSDFLATILLKNFSSFKQDNLLRAFVRLLSGSIAGSIVAVPFFYANHAVAAVVSAVAISFLLCLILNYYHAVISDHPVRKKVLRIFFAYIIVIFVAAGVGYLSNATFAG
jgi:VIT1/CCC1 family predicted Fe2+/Mn2+ transporter